MPPPRGKTPIYKYIGIGSGVSQAPLPLPLIFIRKTAADEKLKNGWDRMTTEFFIPMKKVPTVTHQEKQVTVVNGKPMFYEPAELKAARVSLMAHLGRHAPDKPYSRAVRLIVKWCFPLKGKHLDGEWKTTKPDIDNSQKLLQDCMTEIGFWKDDAQVVSLVAEKFWARLPGIYIKIDEV